jgi:hypothetical protein
MGIMQVRQLFNRMGLIVTTVNSEGQSAGLNYSPSCRMDMELVCSELREVRSAP